MAHIFADNVREGSVTEGTGNFVLEGGIPAPGGVIVGRRFSSVLTNGDTFDYSIFHQSLDEWEIGVGTYLGANAFSRNPTVSSNNDSLVNFSEGTKQVFIAPVSQRMTDVLDNSRLPAVQTGKTFTSTVTVTGQSGLRIVYDDQQFAIGGTDFDPPDYASVIRHVDPGVVTWYVDADKMSTGFRFRFHDSGDNFRNRLVVHPTGSCSIGDLNIHSDTLDIGGTPVKIVSQATTDVQVTFPVGHTVYAATGGASLVSRNNANGVRIHSGSQSMYVLNGGSDQGAQLAGTWRARGRDPESNAHLMERTA